MVAGPALPACLHRLQLWQGSEAEQKRAASCTPQGGGCQRLPSWRSGCAPALPAGTCIGKTPVLARLTAHAASSIAALCGQGCSTAPHHLSSSGSEPRLRGSNLHYKPCSLSRKHRWSSWLRMHAEKVGCMRCRRGCWSSASAPEVAWQAAVQVCGGRVARKPHVPLCCCHHCDIPEHLQRGMATPCSASWLL
jgi:hypothetical protein